MTVPTATSSGSEYLRKPILFHPPKKKKSMQQDALFKEPALLWQGLQRLHATDTSILFPNSEGSFRLLIRPLESVKGEEDDDDDMVFDVCLVARPDLSDEQEAMWDMLLEQEQDGCWDEDSGMFVMEEFQVSMKDSHDDRLVDVMSRLNALCATRVCGCQLYLLKDSHDLCVFCVMTGVFSEVAKEFCCICQSQTARKHMKAQPCCQQWMHASCLEAWKENADTPSCPTCRKQV